MLPPVWLVMFLFLEDHLHGKASAAHEILNGPGGTSELLASTIHFAMISRSNFGRDGQTCIPKSRVVEVAMFGTYVKAETYLHMISCHRRTKLRRKANSMNLKRAVPSAGLSCYWKGNVVADVFEPRFKGIWASDLPYVLRMDKP